MHLHGSRCCSTCLCKKSAHPHVITSARSLSLHPLISSSLSSVSTSCPISSPPSFCSSSMSPSTRTPAHTQNEEYGPVAIQKTLSQIQHVQSCTQHNHISSREHAWLKSCKAEDCTSLCPFNICHPRVMSHSLAHRTLTTSTSSVSHPFHPLLLTFRRSHLCTQARCFSTAEWRINTNPIFHMVHLERDSEKPRRHHLKGNRMNPLSDNWHPPICQNYKTESGCTFGENCIFRHNEVDSQPNKKPNKSGGKGSVALLSESNRARERSPFYGRTKKCDQIAPSLSPNANYTT